MCMRRSVSFPKVSGNFQKTPSFIVCGFCPQYNHLPLRHSTTLNRGQALLHGRQIRCQASDISSPLGDLSWHFSLISAPLSRGPHVDYCVRMVSKARISSMMVSGNNCWNRSPCKVSRSSTKRRQLKNACFTYSCTTLRVGQEALPSSRNRC